MPTLTPAATRGIAGAHAPHSRHHGPERTLATSDRPRLVSRAFAVLLWGIGSTYLVSTELAAEQPNMIVAAATPALWAAVIALPILAERARLDRQWLAAALLSLAALIGAAYTISGTLSRQAGDRDARVDAAADTSRRRAAMQADIDTNEAELAAARRRLASECATGAGKRCEGVEKVIGLYQGTLKAQRADLAKLGHTAPTAGEKRIAAVLALFIDRPASEIERAVGLLMPALLGLLLEVAAFAFAKYGWSADRPRTVNETLTVDAPSDLAGQSDYPALSAADAAKVSAFLLADDRFGPTGGTSGGPSGGSARPPKGPGPLNPDGRKDEVLAALLTDLALGRSAASQRDLCGRFGVPRSTMSDWLGEWERSGLIPARRTVGRCKAVG